MKKKAYHHHRSRRPDAIVFPPNQDEKGSEVVDRIFRSFGLSDKFNKAVNEQVKDLISQHPADDASLKDLTHVPFITIDNDNSMDLDQALFIRRTKSQSSSDSATTNGYVVSYALADGAYFVPPMSPLFQHALRHGGTSFYLPGKCIPMLPRELSEDHMSLNPHVKRRSLVFDIHLDDKGKAIKTEYAWAAIIVCFPHPV